MSLLTVDCNVKFHDAHDADGSVHFTYEDIPIELRCSYLADVVDKISMKSVNFHANDDHTICNLHNLYEYWLGGQFNAEMRCELQSTEDAIVHDRRIKYELKNEALKLTAPTDVIMQIIIDAGIIDVRALKQKYPVDWDEFAMNHAQASTSGNNQVFKIYEKSFEIFPIMNQMRGMRGGRKNDRRIRRIRRIIRSRRKAKRSAKSMKRSRVHKHRQ
jgi:hypothetical protein